MIAFGVNNEALPIVRILIFRDVDFKRTVAFLGAGVALALVFFRPGFVGCASITDKYDLVYLFGSSVVV